MMGEKSLQNNYIAQHKSNSFISIKVNIQQQPSTRYTCDLDLELVFPGKKVHCVRSPWVKVKSEINSYSLLLCRESCECVQHKYMSLQVNTARNMDYITKPKINTFLLIMHVIPDHANHAWCSKAYLAFTMLEVFCTTDSGCRKSDCSLTVSTEKKKCLIGHPDKH